MPAKDHKKLVLRYTIKAVVEVPADDPEALVDCMEAIREYGSAEVETVETLKE